MIFLTMEAAMALANRSKPAQLFYLTLAFVLLVALLSFLAGQGF